MTTSYLPYAPGQQMLLPAALQDWLPERHLAYFINSPLAPAVSAGTGARRAATRQ